MIKQKREGQRGNVERAGAIAVQEPGPWPGQTDVAKVRARSDEGRKRARSERNRPGACPNKANGKKGCAV